MKDCIKLLLGFEKWVKNSNPIVDFTRAVGMLKVLIESIQSCFPRDDTYGWHIPKMHVFSKMLCYMKQFGKAKKILVR